MNILKRTRQVRDPASYAIKQSTLGELPGKSETQRRTLWKQSDLGELLGKSETQRNNPRAKAKFKKKRAIKKMIENELIIEK